MNELCASHTVLTRWEVDPGTSVYTRRCVRCGSVQQRITQRELDRLDPLDVPAALVRHVIAR